MTKGPEIRVWEKLSQFVARPSAFCAAAFGTGLLTLGQVGEIDMRGSGAAPHVDASPHWLPNRFCGTPAALKM